MDPKVRRETEIEALRRKILDAARELFATEGFKNVTMRKIASKIGYTPPTIYNYFKDKTDILITLENELYEKVLSRFEEIERLDVSPRKALELVLRSHIDLGLNDPHRYRISLMIPHDEFNNPNDALPQDSLTAQIWEKFIGFVAACKRSDCSRHEIWLAAQTCMVCVHGLVSMLILRPIFPWVDHEVLKNNIVETAMRAVEEDSRE